MKKYLFSLIGIILLPFAASAQNWAGDLRSMNQLQGVKFMVPAGWTLHQDFRENETLVMGFSKGDDYFRIYVKRSDGFEFSDTFPKISQTSVEQLGPFSWKVATTSHQSSDGRNLVHLKTFSTEHRGYVYYGFARSTSSGVPQAMVREFLGSLLVEPINGGRSLTGVGYIGKKHFLAFGDYLSGFMGNEVKYDMKHTQDIFTKQWGGNYLGSVLHGNHVGGSDIRSKWRSLGDQMGNQDMYVQYSSGHGSHTGLAIGVRYDEIRDNALSYPAKEVIIFTMACHSGNLVSSFNRKQNEWQNWQQQGRTLYVMASSQPHETSSTGPMTDPDEPGGPSGSAGSAFGHALWKALIGNADGFVDGVKDGFISLAEIKDYTIWKTRKVGGHTPVVTGAYNGGLIMNRTPSREFVESLERGTEGMSEAEVMELIHKLDEEYRIR